MGPIVLASSSQRRMEILSALGIPFKSFPQNIDEDCLENLPPPDRVLELARSKVLQAVAGLDAKEPCIVLGADTLVCDPSPPTPEMDSWRDSSGSICFGKPRDRDDALRMTSSLAGRSHWVHTGVAAVIVGDGRFETAVSSSLVRFADISRGEISAYLDSGEWEGVAGAYRIQGRAACFIDRIEGSWSGIVGLPIYEVYVILSRLGWSFSPKVEAPDRRMPS